MDLIVVLPRVVKRFIEQFPETQNNAYKYFNYDNRIVDERVERFDQKPLYRGPEDLTDQDYNSLVDYAETIINPILRKYSPVVACEDALHTAIRSYNNGVYDSKINASKFQVLLKSMLDTPKFAKKSEKKKPVVKSIDPIVLKPLVLKQLGLNKKNIPRKRNRLQIGPSIVKEKGKPVLIK